MADFIGEGVFLPAKVLSPMNVEIELGELKGDVPLPCQQGCDTCGKGCHVEVLLRPDDVVHDDTSALKAEVVRKIFRGGDFIYTLRLDSGREVLALVPSHHDHAVGEKIGIRLDADHVITFPEHRRGVSQAPRVPACSAGASCKRPTVLLMQRHLHDRQFGRMLRAWTCRSSIPGMGFRDAFSAR